MPRDVILSELAGQRSDRIMTPRWTQTWNTAVYFFQASYAFMFCSFVFLFWNSAQGSPVTNFLFTKMQHFYRFSSCERELFHVLAWKTEKCLLRPTQAYSQVRLAMTTAMRNCYLQNFQLFEQGVYFIKQTKAPKYKLKWSFNKSLGGCKECNINPTKYFFRRATK